MTKCIPAVPSLNDPPFWDWQGWFLIGDLFLLFLVLFNNWLSIDFAMIAATLMLMATQIVTTQEGLAGFSNPGILAVACLFVVAEALASTGAIDFYLSKILARPKSIGAALLRMFIPTTFLAAFISSTAVVALMTPILLRWCRQTKISPSQIFMPLCFAVHLGGTCTLIGTTTNLVIAGLAQSYYCTNMGIFHLVPVGVPSAICGLGIMLLLSPQILPDQTEYDRRTKFSHQQKPGVSLIRRCFAYFTSPKTTDVTRSVHDGLSSSSSDLRQPLNHVDEGFEIAGEAHDADFVFHALFAFFLFLADLVDVMQPSSLN